MTDLRARLIDAAGYALCAAFAGITALTSTLLPHRGWGAIAWIGYAAAGVAVFALGRFRVVPLVFAATALLPLTVEAVQRAAGRTDRAQEEVLVVEQMGHRLTGTGTPYLGHAAIAALPEPDRLLAYAPYQPGMALFGLPRAAFGPAWWTDARVWFAVVTVLCLWYTWSLLGPITSPDRSIRLLQAVAVLPLCTLTLATGGDDLPVLTLCLLATALAARDRNTAAGLVVGLAGALKLFALPVALVLLVLAWTARTRPSAKGRPSANARPSTDGSPSGDSRVPADGPTPADAASRAASEDDARHAATGRAEPAATGEAGPAAPDDPGRAAAGDGGPDSAGLALAGRASAGFASAERARRAGRFALGAFGLPLLALLPALLVDFDAYVENALRFPAGHGLVTSPAQSPLPGHLIAASIAGGRTIALALLLLAGAAIAVRLYRRPPATAGAAAAYVAAGLTAAIMLTPSTRFGYLLYPVAFVALWWSLRPPAPARPMP